MLLDPDNEDDEEIKGER